MNTKPLHLTQEGLEELKKELEGILNHKLPQATERVRLAREQGDLAENSEYHAAREDLNFIQGRVEELEALIAKATVVKKATGSKKVAIGSQVTVTSHAGDNHTFHIVGRYEADPADKKISDESPLGLALLGRKEGEKVEYEAPVGKILYTIDKIH